jgi:hypothetical protein
VNDNPDRDDELLDLTQLIDMGMTAEDARAVLGPHTALPRREARERHEMLRREQGGRL